jgi:hypothetical protein
MDEIDPFLCQACQYLRLSDQGIGARRTSHANEVNNTPRDRMAGWLSHLEVAADEKLASHDE